jgi:hypothetical protein
VFTKRCPPLDEGVLDGAVDRMAGYIVALQPLLDSWLKDQHGSG